MATIKKHEAVPLGSWCPDCELVWRGGLKVCAQIWHRTGTDNQRVWCLKMVSNLELGGINLGGGRLWKGCIRMRTQGGRGAVSLPKDALLLFICSTVRCQPRMGLCCLRQCSYRAADMNLTDVAISMSRSDEELREHQGCGLS